MIISQTPSNTPSNTPSYSPTQTSCPETPNITITQTQTQTITPTPSTTFCYEPQAYLVLDAASGQTALNAWMASQGSSFRGCNIGILPSNTLSVYESQMNAYLNYSGWGVTTFYIEDEPIVSTTSLLHLPEQEWAGTNVWNTWFVPTCPFCDGGNWTKWNGATLSSLQYNKVFYYSGSSIPQGYYRWLTTYTAANQRLSSEPTDHTLDTLVGCVSPTPTPTITQTATPTINQTATPSMTSTPTETIICTFYYANIYDDECNLIYSNVIVSPNINNPTLNYYYRGSNLGDGTIVQFLSLTCNTAEYFTTIISAGTFECPPPF